jgi:hypothetical protein
MADQPQQRISEATKEVDRRDAQAEHGAPQTPTADEAAAADSNGPVSEETKEAYQDFVEKGANAKGEGRLP